MPEIRRHSIAVFVLCIILGAGAWAVEFSPSSTRADPHEIFVSGMIRKTRLNRKKPYGNPNPLEKVRYNPAAVALGYRYSADRWSAGIVATYEEGRARLHYSHIVQEHYLDRTVGVTLFGKYTAASGWYASASVFAGNNEKEVKGGQTPRAGVPGAGRVETGGPTYSIYGAASVEVGRSFELGKGVSLTPHAGIDLSYTPYDRLPSWHRVGLNFWGTIPVPKNWVYEIPVGVTVAKDFCFRDWVVTPSLDLTAVSSPGKTDIWNRNFRTGFAGYDGSRWRVYNLGADQWGCRGTVNFRIAKSERVDLDVSYTFEKRHAFNDNRVAARFSLHF